jgi:PAS domain S-box-containing protein
MRLSQFPLWPLGTRADPAAADESVRAKVIASHGVGQLTDDPELQHIVAFAAALCASPTALVTIVERERQWFMARWGMEKRETPRPTSFCAHAMLGESVMVIPDAIEDPRFADNPLVTGADNIRFYAGAPLVSSEGVALGALCVIDTTARPEGLSDLQRQGLEVLARAVMQRLTCERVNASAGDALDEADRRLLQLAEHIPVFAWSTDEAGIVEFANSAFYDYLGTRDPAKLNFVALAHPDDCENIVRIRSESRARNEKWEARARVRSADGSYRWMMIRAWPVRTGEDADVTHWFGAAVDIDDLHSLSENRDLLARELSHRIKNIFAVVSGLVSLRARGREELKSFASELNEVFHALGRAHDYVRPLEGRKGDSLHELLRDLLAPYRGSAGEGIAITGDDAAIGPRAATPLALVFHELATNSAKYGALSAKGGDIAIAIAREDDEVAIAWRETVTGGAEPGASEGFGTRLLKTSVEGQLGGKYERRFSSHGLDVVLRFPLDTIAA